jgi:predicted ATP-dependent serine protease
MGATDPKPRLYTLGLLLPEALAEAEARHAARQAGRPLGPLTGFKTVDAELCGALTPGLHVLHGAPGAGKTALALQIACSCGCPALYLTCEMAPIELMRRVAARVNREYLGRFKTGEHTRERSLELFTRAADDTPLLAILDATQAPATPADISENADVVRQQIGDGNPHLLIVVDSVHSWARAGQGDIPEYETLNVGLGKLREISQHLGAAILGIGERNRASQSGGMSATAGTRVFEYGSETLLSLEREKDAKPDANGDLEVTLKLEKNRHGVPGKRILMLFHGATQTFRETR